MIVTRQCGVELLQQTLHGAAVRICLRKLRVEPDCVVVTAQRLIQLIELPEHVAAVTVDLGMRRIDRGGSIIAGQRLIPSPQLAQNVAAIAVGHGVIRLQSDGSIVAGQRGMQLVEFQQYGSSVAVRGRIGRFEPNGPVKQLYRRGKAVILGSKQRPLEQRRELVGELLLHSMMIIWRSLASRGSSHSPKMLRRRTMSDPVAVTFQQGK